MNSYRESGLLTGIFDNGCHFFFGFVDHFFDSGGMDSSINNQFLKGDSCNST